MISVIFFTYKKENKIYEDKKENKGGKMLRGIRKPVRRGWRPRSKAPLLVWELLTQG